MNNILLHNTGQPLVWLRIISNRLMGRSILLLVVFLISMFMINTPVYAAPPPTPTHPDPRLPGQENNVFLPLVSRNSYPSRLSGAVTVLTGPNPCDDQSCYTLEITCPSLTQANQAFLTVGEPDSGVPVKGVILFASGFTGKGLWQDRSPEALRVIAELRAAGFRTIQIAWLNSWFQAASDQLDGLGKLACRPATVARWVSENLVNSGEGDAFCATGWSNGASQFAYSLVQYDQANLFSSLVFESGPNFTRLDQACIQDDPVYQTLWYDGTGRSNVDQSYGFLNYGTGHCFDKNTDFRRQFVESSLVSDYWEYVFPNTSLGFIFGENDTTTTVAHARDFLDTLTKAGSPLLRTETVAGASHNIVQTVEGANKIRDLLISECSSN